MIEETKKRIHFHPYTQVKGRPVDTKAPPVASVSLKYGSLKFPKSSIQEMHMSGKFVRLFYEPHRKIIGWQIKDRVEQNQMKVWKLCKPMKSTGQYVMGVKKMLDEMRLKPNGNYNGLTIKKYREMSQLSEYKDAVFFFIELDEHSGGPQVELNNPKNKNDNESESSDTRTYSRESDGGGGGKQEEGT